MPIANTVLEGHLGSDPELQYSSEGKPRCKARLAVNTGWGDNQEVTWWNLIMFGTTAENFNKILSKGSRVTVVGTPSAPELTNAAGEKFKYPKVVVNDFSLPPKNENPTRSTHQQQNDDMPF